MTSAPRGLLADAIATAVIDAPIEAVDLADWLFTLGDAEYQRCAPGEHIAAGATTTDDGRPMSINVEQVGGALAIQHYIGEVVTPAHCRLVSLSDTFTPSAAQRCMSPGSSLSPLPERTNASLPTAS